MLDMLRCSHALDSQRESSSSATCQTHESFERCEEGGKSQRSFIYIYMYIYIYICIVCLHVYYYTYTYIYIYRERERDIFIHIYIYIYTHDEERITNKRGRIRQVALDNIILIIIRCYTNYASSVKQDNTYSTSSVRQVVPPKERLRLRLLLRGGGLRLLDYYYHYY